MATSEAADVRSPKRQAVKPTSSMITALDESMWTSIIEFLPVRTDSAEKTVDEAAATLQTLLNLRLLCKELAELLHPTKNVALWQKLVLLTFDFSATDQTWNIENYQDEYNLPFDRTGEEYDEDDEEDTKKTAKAIDTATNPQRLAMEGRWDDRPPNMLDEDFVLWDKLGIYVRPSQYGFLTSLQQNPPTGRWPSNEDPHSLFHDLVHLLRLPDGNKMDAGGEGGEPLIKCLVAPVSNSDPSSPFYSHYVMQKLGYAPQFWTSGRGIGKAKKESTDPNALKETLEQQKEQHQRYYRDQSIMDEDSFDATDEFGFPSCSIGQAKQLHECIKQSYSDWRSVCCNSGCDGDTPVFFVGKSKAPPHRWTGYGGDKTWT